MRSHLLPPENHRLFWRRVALAPACLLLVAGLHLYRVRHSEQSQWKGGGFGMFSTVDMPKARVLRVYATTAEGRRPVAIPERLQKIASELRTAPTQAGVDELARELAKLTYRDEQARQRARGAAIEAALKQGVMLDAKSFANDWADKNVRPTPNNSGESRALVAGKETSGPIIAVSKIEVEVWRMNFARASDELTVKPWLKSAVSVSKPLSE